MEESSGLGSAVEPRNSDESVKATDSKESSLIKKSNTLISQESELIMIITIIIIMTKIVIIILAISVTKVKLLLIPSLLELR